MTSRRSIPVSGLTGRFGAPGDKSISHRALMLGTLSVGETRITGLLEGEDVLATAAAMRALGATVTRDDDGTWRVNGVGVGGLLPPEDVLDMGNSGTAVRLLMGMLATHPIDATLTGDASLRSRPMKRVIEPLRLFTARFEPEDTDRLPLTVHGARNPVPIEYDVPVPSAQVKSAVLLAGLNTPGITTVIERTPTRDHTENMLRHFSADINVTAENGGRRIELIGQPELVPSPIAVPGDPSSAAFPIVAALITPGSEIRIDRVGTNPLRAGLFDTLTEMGADLTFENGRDEGGEPVADIVAKSSALKGIVVPPARAASMIDEYPILAIAAAFAEGQTVMDGIGELRIKESDRIAAMAKGLMANGVDVEEMPEGMIVTGTGGAAPGGGTVETFMDHRIAMSFLVMGCASAAPVAIDADEMIATSFPGFAELMTRAGAQFEAAA